MVLAELPVEGRVGVVIVDQDCRARGTRSREDGTHMFMEL